MLPVFFPTSPRRQSERQSSIAGRSSTPGYPYYIPLDQGSQFKDTFVSISRAAGVDVDKYGIEAHNALGFGERYHHPLRNTFLKLGLCDARDLRFQTLDNHHCKDLSMKPLRSDTSMYSSLVNGHLTGPSGTYFDDMLPLATMISKPAEDESPPLTFTVFHLTPTADNPRLLQIDQNGYVDRMFLLSSDVTFSDFASLRMQLA